MQDSGAQLKAESQAAQSDLTWVLSEVKAGKLSQQEAEDCISSISDSAPSVKAASAAVRRAESAGLEDVREQESAGLRESGWVPKMDDSVRLLKLGGKPGKVRSAHCLDCLSYE